MNNTIYELSDGGTPYIFDDADGDSKITVLLVDDDPDMTDLTATYLAREQGEFDVTTMTDVHEALNFIHREGETLEAIVSDFDMPVMDGLEFLGEVRKEWPDIPFILFTGKGSEEIAGKAISKGVTDYLQKGSGASKYSVLANRLQNAVKQYRSTKALKHSQEKFSKLVMNSTDVICIVSEGGRFEYISPPAEHILGITPEEMIGDSVFEYVHPDDRQEVMEDFFAAVENPEMEPIIEFRFNSPDDDDDEKVLECRGKNLLDDDLINGFVVNTRDITALKQRERILKQHNEQLENMRNVISHDLRNPLNVALDSLLLFRETKDESQLETTENALSRIDNLIEQTLSLTNDQVVTIKPQPVSLSEVVQSAWEMVDTTGSELHIENSREIEADISHLQQVFENLIHNAVKHNDNPVICTVGASESGIYFEDDGSGIDESIREQIFEFGYTSDATSTGFGLTIVKQILDKHDWDVEVLDAENGGTRFEITGVTFQPTICD